MSANVLFIMADQLRHDWLGCTGADHVATPNIDALAARGVRFTQCITPAPICAPARISLATGLLPHRTGALTNRDYLPERVPTYYQRLRDHGYHVGCVGKLDLAKPDRYNGIRGDRPRAYGWGFTHPVEVEGKDHAGRSDQPHGPYGAWLQKQGLLEKLHRDYTVTRKQNPWIRYAAGDSVLPTEAFADLWIARRAVQWLDDSSGDFPWHLFVSFVGPHNPFDPPTEYADRYPNAPMPEPIADDRRGKPDWLVHAARSGSPEQWAVVRRQYSASVTAIDDGVGMLVKALEARDWLEDTVIVFASDHGEMLGDHGLFGKHVAYEPSCRVPLLFCGPGVRQAGASEALVELQDVNPTICEIAGAPVLAGTDAMSLRKILIGEPAEYREVSVTQEYNYRALRTKRWKLIDNFNAGKELYDLEDDPDELINLAEIRGDIATELTRALQARFTEGEQRR